MGKSALGLLGCGCAAALGAPLLLLMVAAMFAAAIFGAGGPEEPGPTPGGWTGDVSEMMRVATIHDLGFGPSDARRVDNMIRSIRPYSPLVGKGSLIVELGRRWDVDPLLIAQWTWETELLTDDSITVPVHNGGNVSWPAALEATRQYGCVPGPTSSGEGWSHTWAACPDVPAGINLWVDYVATYYPTKGADAFIKYVNSYNPCDDPGNVANGYICGTEYGERTLQLIADHAGNPPGTPTGAEGNWFRYQGETGSYDLAGNQVSNCGPSTAAMEIQHVRGLRLEIRQIRSFLGVGGATSADQLDYSLRHWGVWSRRSVGTAPDIPAALRRGHVVIVGLDMGVISRGSDVDGASTSPRLRTGRYYSTDVMHWIIVKGVSPDGRYFTAYDPNVWGAPGTAKYWYSDSTPKGRDRVYSVAEVDVGMRRFSDYPGSRALEVP